MPFWNSNKTGLRKNTEVHLEIVNRSIRSLYEKQSSIQRLDQNCIKQILLLLDQKENLQK